MRSTEHVFDITLKIFAELWDIHKRAKWKIFVEDEMYWYTDTVCAKMLRLIDVQFDEGKY